MRFFYTSIFRLLLPLVLFRLYWRGIKAPLYRQRWQERLGYYSHPFSGRSIWFHAVSVGEAEAALPLIRLIQQRYPHEQILVTTTTPTGSARIQSVLRDSVAHVYLPYDLPAIIQRFLKQFRPKLAVFLEKEIWPNLFAALGEQEIPLYVINARLSARSARAYRKIPALVKPALAQIKLIATQTEADKNQFLSIGASDSQLAVLGNIKFDITIAPEVLAEGKQLKQQWGQRFIWIIASTHQGEEAQLLAHYPRLKAEIPQLLVVIAPRHPERFAAVKIGCEKQGLRVVMRSEQKAVTPDCDVYIADSMGELKMLLAAADVAFVGGSLVDVGGHNVLEPAAAGVPVLFGPIMFNFQLIAEQMLQHQAARQCQDAAAVADAVLALAADPQSCQRLAEQASAFLAANQGAIERIVAVLSPFPL